MDMILELAIATAMVLLTVGIHGAGLLGLARVLTSYAARRRARRVGPPSAEAGAVTALVVLGLFVLHGIEIWSYALLFRLLGAVESLREAIYFSTISYGAIGYGDARIAPSWKLLGAIEGINGAILLGWSVAFFVNVIGRMFPPARRGRRD